LTVTFHGWLGGSGGDAANGIAIDGSGCAYVTGITSSGNFPTTPGAYQSQNYEGGLVLRGDAFVTTLNAAGTGLVY